MSPITQLIVGLFVATILFGIAFQLYLKITTPSGGGTPACTPGITGCTCDATRACSDGSTCVNGTCTAAPPVPPAPPGKITVSNLDVAAPKCYSSTPASQQLSICQQTFGNNATVSSISCPYGQGDCVGQIICHVPTSYVFPSVWNNMNFQTCPSNAHDSSYDAWVAAGGSVPSSGGSPNSYFTVNRFGRRDPVSAMTR